MKKLLGISLLLIYMLGTTGVAVASHFCCNKLASVDLVLTPKVKAEAPHSCNKDCCKDNVRFYKVHADQNVSVNSISVKAPILNVLPAGFLPDVLSLNITPASDAVQPLHSPPLITATPLFLQLSVFRI